jgi:transcriptional regulator with XRE-family HTH domain
LLYGKVPFFDTLSAMTESQRLIATLKRLLKRQGYTYRAVGRAIGLSEQSVKRMFSKGTFTLDRLVQLASILGMSLAEIAEQAGRTTPGIRALTEAQEKELISEPRLLLVAACVVNGWTPAEITGTYKFTKAECLRHLLKLDRLGLITLLPGDRARLNVARDFDWIPGGPIEHFFRRHEREDFLAYAFADECDSRYFLFGMLTTEAKMRLRAQLDKLRDEFAELHRESLAAPFDRRRSACLLVAQREWEPRSFAALRREKK